MGKKGGRRRRRRRERETEREREKDYIGCMSLYKGQGKKRI